MCFSLVWSKHYIIHLKHLSQWHHWSTIEQVTPIPLVLLSGQQWRTGVIQGSLSEWMCVEIVSYFVHLQVCTSSRLWHKLHYQRVYGRLCVDSQFPSNVATAIQRGQLCMCTSPQTPSGLESFIIRTIICSWCPQIFVWVHKSIIKSSFGCLWKERHSFSVKSLLNVLSGLTLKVNIIIW